MRTELVWKPLAGTTCVPSPGIRRAVDHIEQNFAGPIRLADLAAVAGLSLFHFVNVFRTQLGMPPHQYVCHVRVREAQALLRQGLPPAAVALETGFFDQSHLSRHFKRRCGMTPGLFAAGVHAAARAATLRPTDPRSLRTGSQRCA